jgi:hypothetical protein
MAGWAEPTEPNTGWESPTALLSGVLFDYSDLSHYHWTCDAHPVRQRQTLHCVCIPLDNGHRGSKCRVACDVFGRGLGFSARQVANPGRLFVCFRTMRGLGQVRNRNDPTHADPGGFFSPEGRVPWALSPAQGGLPAKASGRSVNMVSRGWSFVDQRFFVAISGIFHICQIGINPEINLRFRIIYRICRIVTI